MDAQRRGVCKRSRHPRQFTSSSSFSTSSFSFPACTRGEVESSHARANCHVPFVYIPLFPPLANQTVRLSLSIYLSRVRTQPSFQSRPCERERLPRKVGSGRSLAQFSRSESFRAYTRTRVTHTHIHTQIIPLFLPSILSFSLALSYSISRKKRTTNMTTVR